MRNVKEEVAKNLLFYRKRKKITQKSLAECLGVSHNTVSQWESGTNSIDTELLFKACKILGVSVNDMYGMYSNAQSAQYTQVETQIIESYRSLNEEGRCKVIDYIDDLVTSGKYAEVHKAAYEKDLNPAVTDEEISEALRIAKITKKETK